ncbi:uncharacterized protein LOC131856787 [Cryptomeria japonica]|uniref:uncharacterized protein LOC131856787 n=1 Tax=Cryptomeria japonica TaxID=3369 RepID=UPI0027D9D9CC|nr:uncharacterized protein LOC131856787 [Cryptomeria japonica]
MRIVTWNVRGLVASDKRGMLKRHLVKIAIDIVLIQETKCISEDIDKLIRFCKEWNGIFSPAFGRAGGLGILWNPSLVNITKSFEEKQGLSCQVQHRLSKLELELWNIYGPTNSQEKAKLWEEIRNCIAKNGNKKIIIGGDFNVILELADKRGGIRKVTRDILDFRNFIQKIEVVDCKPTDGWFTWNNRRQG